MKANMSRFSYQLFVIFALLGCVWCIKVEVAQKRQDISENNVNQDSYLDALQKNREEDGSQR